MEKEKIFELFDYMTSSGKSVFVNDFTGWGEEAHIPGYPSFPSMEGNGIRSEATGAEFEPQCETVRRGNHLEVYYRGEERLVKRVILGDLFPKGVPVVIVTGGEALRRVAPMLKRRSELIDWLMMVHCYCEHRKIVANPVSWFWEGNMIDLATFLYRNRPDKIEDKSIYDRLTAV